MEFLLLAIMHIHKTALKTAQKLIQEIRPKSVVRKARYRSYKSEIGALQTMYWSAILEY
ncbi:MAG: hypothetical protein IKU35_03980 [Bacteroidaceae bacterium]|nr:hypothetical protein [Bacteroidaceae bacterium]